MTRPIGFMLVLLALAVGCGERHPPVAPVAGVVTYEGQPVTGGRVLFLPLGGGKQGLGTINADGSFRLSTYLTHDGALVGTHRALLVDATLPKGKNESATFKRSKNAPLVVEGGKENQLVIELPGKDWSQDD